MKNGDIMSKKEEEILTKIEGVDGQQHEAKIILASPEETAAKKKRADKLSAMKMAFSYIEIRRVKADVKESIKIADEYLEWLEK